MSWSSLLGSVGSLSCQINSPRTLKWSRGWTVDVEFRSCLLFSSLFNICHPNIIPVVLFVLSLKISPRWGVNVTNTVARLSHAFKEMGHHSPPYNGKITWKGTSTVQNCPCLGSLEELVFWSHFSSFSAFSLGIISNCRPWNAILAFCEFKKNMGNLIHMSLLRKEADSFSRSPAETAECNSCQGPDPELVNVFPALPPPSS